MALKCFKFSRSLLSAKSEASHGFVVKRVTATTTTFRQIPTLTVSIVSSTDDSNPENTFTVVEGCDPTAAPLKKHGRFCRLLGLLRRKASQQSAVTAEKKVPFGEPRAVLKRIFKWNRDVIPLHCNMDRVVTSTVANNGINLQTKTTDCNKLQSNTDITDRAIISTGISDGTKLQIKNTEYSLLHPTAGNYNSVITYTGANNGADLQTKTIYSNESQPSTDISKPTELIANSESAKHRSAVTAYSYPTACESCARNRNRQTHASSNSVKITRIRATTSDLIRSTTVDSDRGELTMAYNLDTDILERAAVAYRALRSQRMAMQAIVLTRKQQFDYRDCIAALNKPRSLLAFVNVPSPIYDTKRLSSISVAVCEPEWQNRLITWPESTSVTLIESVTIEPSLDDQEDISPSITEVIEQPLDDHEDISPSITKVIEQPLDDQEDISLSITAVGANYLLDFADSNGSTLHPNGNSLAQTPTDQSMTTDATTTRIASSQNTIWIPPQMPARAHLGRWTPADHVWNGLQMRRPDELDTAPTLFSESSVSAKPSSCFIV